MSGSRRFRAVSTIVFFVLSAGILVSWRTNNLFPWLHAATLAGSVLLLFSCTFDMDFRRQFGWTVAVVTVVSVTYRVTLTLFPDTLHKVDPEKYALFSRLTIQTGDYTFSQLDFYGTAGGFHTFVAETALVTGLAPEHAIVVAAIVIGVWMPAVVASFTLLLFDDRKRAYAAGALGAIIAGVAALSVRMSMIPIAQSFGTVLFVTFVFLVVKELYTGHESQAWTNHAIAMFLLLITNGLTHKIPLLMTTGAVGVTWTVTKIASNGLFWPFEQTDRSLPTVVLGLTVVVLVLQQQLVSSYTSRAVRRASNLAEGADEVPIRTGQEPAAATAPDPGVWDIFGSHAHAPVILAFAGIAWLVIARQMIASDQRPRPAVVGFLSMVGAVTGLVIFSIAGAQLPDAIHPFRIHALQEALLAALCGAGMIVFRDLAEQRFSVLSLQNLFRGLLVVMVVILTFHSFASVVSPEYPGEERGYATESEFAGKEFAAEYTTGTVHTDNQMVSRTPYPERIEDKESPWAQLGTLFGVRFESNTNEIVNGTAIEARHETVLLRPDVEIYETGSSFKNYRYRTQWDVETAADREYNRVYDSGGAVLYRNRTVG